MTAHPRRAFLDQLGRSGAVLAFGALLAARSHPSAAPSLVRIPGGDDPFTLGVASGMPRPDSVMLWTRLAPRPFEPLGGLEPKPVTVRWEVAEDDRFARVLRRGEVTAEPQAAHSVHVAVDGLPSASVFFYRFIAGGVASPVGRTRTAPADDAPVSRLRLALASCQHYEQGEYLAHREIAARDLDLVLFVGDYLYESSNPRFRLRPHRGPPPQTLDDYRARHAQYKLDPDLQAAHAAHPWVLTWDDHEVENDYADDLSPSGFEPARFLRRRAAAYQAYFEHMPLAPDMAPQGASLRIHDRYRWGRLAELWTLDNRQYRDVQPCSAPGRAGGRVLTDCAALPDPARSLFGFDQERWLAQGLAASDRRWKLLGQGTQIVPGGIATPLGRRIHTDGWDGYPAARERLMRAIAEPATSGVLCLGGDVHRHVAADLRLRPNDAGSPVVASEFVCTSVTSHGLSEALTALMRDGNPDIRHARSDERGYVLLDLDADMARCDFRAVPAAPDPGGSAALRSQASFVVAPDRPGVEAA